MSQLYGATKTCKVLFHALGEHSYTTLLPESAQGWGQEVPIIYALKLTLLGKVPSLRVVAFFLDIWITQGTKG